MREWLIMREFEYIKPTQTEIQFAVESRAMSALIANYFRVPSDLMSMTVTGRRKVWRGPSERFVEYDDRDEEWMRYFGLGREVEETDTLNLHSCYVDSVERGVTKIVAFTKSVEVVQDAFA